jgi:hypothetical protein
LGHYTGGRNQQLGKRLSVGSFGRTRLEKTFRKLPDGPLGCIPNVLVFVVEQPGEVLDAKHGSLVDSAESRGRTQSHIGVRISQPLDEWLDGGLAADFGKCSRRGSSLTGQFVR